jgi:hypothetical protein
MRYKGKIGELKPAGFLIALMLSLLIALIIYKQFTFVTEPTKNEDKAMVDQLAKRISALEEQNSELAKRTSQLESRSDRLENAKTNANPRH